MRCRREGEAWEEARQEILKAGAGEAGSGGTGAARTSPEWEERLSAREDVGEGGRKGGQVVGEGSEVGPASVSATVPPGAGGLGGGQGRGWATRKESLSRRASPQTTLDRGRHPRGEEKLAQEAGRWLQEATAWSSSDAPRSPGLGSDVPTLPARVRALAVSSGVGGSTGG